MTKSHWLTFALAFLCLTAVSLADSAASQVIVGDARFTIITPNLIRIEQGRFTDEPTLFASDRASRFDGAKITLVHGGVTIDTGDIQLVYTSDGKPLSADNLKATIHGQTWTPGQTDPQNLGGTLRTLDGVSGPKPLPPGLLSRSGWAVVDDSNSPILTKDWVAVRPGDAASTDWYLFGYGQDFHAALTSLTAISGKIPLPRKNQLGVWYSRYWPYKADEFKQIVQEYNDHQFPLDNIVMDMDWHLTQVPGAKTHSSNHQVWTGYTWDTSLIPDPPALLKWFHDQGLQVTLNDHPSDGVQRHESMYADFTKAMGQDPSTKIEIPFDAGSKKYLDTFYAFTHKPLEKMGVDFWWLDWQQYPFTRSVPTLTNLQWLNHYNYIESQSGGRRGASFSRWGGWGDQKYPIHFSGDANTNWPMLAFEVPFTSTSSNAGCFFWTHDIGGHMGGRNEESYARWCQFGALSASLRSHSTRKAEMDRRPWTYPDWAEASMKVSFQLRSRLMPYIYTSAQESCANTVPLIRPMYFDHPDQDPAYSQAQEYQLGDNLLVAPITMPGVGPTRTGWQVVWFPQNDGPWYNFFTNEAYQDGQYLIASDLNQFPLFVRGGVPLPMQPFQLRPATAPINTLVLRCYPGVDGKTGTSTLYEDDGQTLAYQTGASATTKLTYARAGDRHTITIAPTEGHYDNQPAQRGYILKLPCLQKPTSVMIDNVNYDIMNNHMHAPENYDPDTFTLNLQISPRPITQGTQIIIDAPVVDPETIQEQLASARLAEVLGRNIPPDSIANLLPEALKATDPDIQRAALASLGFGFFPHNDSPYLYNGKTTYQTFNPGVQPDSDDAFFFITASDKSALIPQDLVAIATPTCDDTQLHTLANSLHGPDTIVLHGHEPLLTFELKLAGQTVHITHPLPVLPADPNFPDLARRAVASSPDKHGNPDLAIDGIVGGPAPYPPSEWTSGKKTGGSITLTWPTEEAISDILLFDRIDPTQNILSGKITFSDGSAESFDALPRAGQSPKEIKFPAKTIRWLRVEIQNTSDTTTDAGLSEIGVFK